MLCSKKDDRQRARAFKPRKGMRVSVLVYVCATRLVGEYDNTEAARIVLLKSGLYTGVPPATYDVSMAVVMQLKGVLLVYPQVKARQFCYHNYYH